MFNIVEYFDQLQQDHATITDVLQARRTVTMETLSVGAQPLLKMYVMILEDALSTLDAPINYLKVKVEPTLDVQIMDI